MKNEVQNWVRLEPRSSLDFRLTRQGNLFTTPNILRPGSRIGITSVRSYRHLGQALVILLTERRPTLGHGVVGAFLLRTLGLSILPGTSYALRAILQALESSRLGLFSLRAVRCTLSSGRSFSASNSPLSGKGFGWARSSFFFMWC